MLILHIKPSLPGRMCFEVLTIAKRYQVLRMVVLAIAVNMVNLLVGLKLATIRLLPDKAVLQNVAVLIGEVMSWQVNHDVAAGTDISTAFPLRMGRSLLPQERTPVAGNEAEHMTTNYWGISTTTAFAQSWRWVQCAAFLLQCLSRQFQMMARDVFRLPIFVLWTIGDWLATATATDRTWNRCLLCNSFLRPIMTKLQVVMGQKARWVPLMSRVIGYFATASALTGSSHGAPPMWALYHTNRGESI